MYAVGERGLVDRDDAAVAGDERGDTVEVEPVRGLELDSGGARDLFGEGPDPDAVPVDVTLSRPDAAVDPDSPNRLVDRSVRLGVRPPGYRGVAHSVPAGR